MTERELITLLGAEPSQEQIAEHLGDFLVAHGFHDAAKTLREAMDRCSTYYDDEPF